MQISDVIGEEETGDASLHGPNSRGNARGNARLGSPLDETLIMQYAVQRCRIGGGRGGGLEL
jgi:hypothetical protein